jgi:hypothetical protein
MEPLDINDFIKFLNKDLFYRFLRSDLSYEKLEIFGCLARCYRNSFL